MIQILVVDDDFAIVEMLQVFLKEEGYQVLTANNGREALAQLTASIPALIICDLMMPVMGGREMCRELQTNPRYRAIPIILMSAVVRHVSQAECHYASLLSKPFDLNKLFGMIQQLLPPA